MEPARKTELRFSLSGFLALNATMIFASGFLAFVLVRSMTVRAPDEAAAEQARGATSRGSLPGSRPPWGELSVQDFDLDRPDEYASFEVQPQRPTWMFAGATREQVRNQLSSAQVPGPQIDRALGPELLEESPTGLLIHPDLTLALALEPEGRSELYRALGKSPANRLMNDPYRMRDADFERWFSNGLVDARTLETLKRLLYPCGKMVCFSDYELLLEQIAAPQQRIAVAKVLSRRHVLDASLRVRPDADVDKLVEYWSGGARGKDLRPLLESMKRSPDGGAIGIAYVLPQFARMRLYTFPTATDAGDDPMLNCHWTTFNFFNDTPDRRFGDWSYAGPYLTEHFFRVGNASRFGDRIFLVSKSGVPVHSAVYLADDIVFTKNGSGVGQPWILMHFQDMVDFYSHSESLAVFAYRAREG